MDNIILINILRAVAAISNIYLFFMFIYAIINLLAVFGVVNIWGEGFLARVYFVLRSIIDPLKNYINRFIPSLGRFDIGFLILVVIMWIINDASTYYIRILSQNAFDF
ncbi:MAG: YggT family protein [Alphaproteobacteria bacterium]|nr:YggT family protein [Alphaproteobacteria bacterium]